MPISLERCYNYIGPLPLQIYARVYFFSLFIDVDISKTFGHEVCRVYRGFKRQNVALRETLPALRGRNQSRVYVDDRHGKTVLEELARRASKRLEGRIVVVFAFGRWDVDLSAQTSRQCRRLYQVVKKCVSLPLLCL